MPVLLEGETSKEPAPRTASGRGQTAGCRRYKRNGLLRTNAAVVFFLSLLLGAGELGRRLKPTLPERRVSGLRLLFCAVRLFRGRSFLVLFFARGSLGHGAFRGSAGGFVPFGRQPGRRALSIGRACRQRLRLPASAGPASGPLRA